MLHRVLVMVGEVWEGRGAMIGMWSFEWMGNRGQGK